MVFNISAHESTPTSIDLSSVALGWEPAVPGLGAGLAWLYLELFALGWGELVAIALVSFGLTVAVSFLKDEQTACSLSRVGQALAWFGSTGLAVSTAFGVSFCSRHGYPQALLPLLALSYVAAIVCAAALLLHEPAPQDLRVPGRSPSGSPTQPRTPSPAGPPRFDDAPEEHFRETLCLAVMPLPMVCETGASGPIADFPSLFRMVKARLEMALSYDKSVLLVDRRDMPGVGASVLKQVLLRLRAKKLVPVLWLHVEPTGNPRTLARKLCTQAGLAVQANTSEAEGIEALARAVRFAASYYRSRDQTPLVLVIEGLQRLGPGTMQEAMVRWLRRVERAVSHQRVCTVMIADEPRPLRPYHRQRPCALIRSPTTIFFENLTLSETTAMVREWVGRVDDPAWDQAVGELWGQAEGLPEIVVEVFRTLRKPRDRRSPRPSAQDLREATRTQIKRLMSSLAPQLALFVVMSESSPEQVSAFFRTFEDNPAPLNSLPAGKRAHARLAISMGLLRYHDEHNVALHHRVVVSMAAALSDMTATTVVGPTEPVSAIESENVPIEPQEEAKALPSPE